MSLCFSFALCRLVQCLFPSPVFSPRCSSVFQCLYLVAFLFVVFVFLRSFSWILFSLLSLLMKLLIKLLIKLPFCFFLNQLASVSVLHVKQFLG